MSPIFNRAAISFSAPATWSACARLSSWHGPAMIEIGKSLPNLTDPAATTGAAEVFAFKALSFFRRDQAGRRRPDQPTPRVPQKWVPVLRSEYAQIIYAVSNIRVAPSAISGG